MTATVEQVMRAYARQRSADRVHLQTQVPFGGDPGHYYFITGRQPTSDDLAQITNLSGRAEVALFGIENFYCVYVGNPGGGSYAGTATFIIPPRNPNPRPGEVPIEHFELIAHTHPLDAASSSTGIASGAGDADREALDAINQRGWQQGHSVVIICRGGQVEEEVRFYPSVAQPRTRQRAPIAPDEEFK